MSENTNPRGRRAKRKDDEEVPVPELGCEFCGRLLASWSDRALKISNSYSPKTGITYLIECVDREDCHRRRMKGKLRVIRGSRT